MMILTYEKPTIRTFNRSNFVIFINGYAAKSDKIDQTSGYNKDAINLLFNEVKM